MRRCIQPSALRCQQPTATPQAGSSSSSGLLRLHQQQSLARPHPSLHPQHLHCSTVSSTVSSSSSTVSSTVNSSSSTVRSTISSTANSTISSTVNPHPPTRKAPQAAIKALVEHLHAAGGVCSRCARQVSSLWQLKHCNLLSGFTDISAELTLRPHAHSLLKHCRAGRHGSTAHSWRHVLRVATPAAAAA